MLRFLSIICCLSVLLLGSGCASPAPDGTKSAQFLTRLTEKHMNTPQPDHLMLCHGHGCRLQSPVKLSKKQWNKVKSVFQPRAKTAEKERSQIAKAFSLLEEYTGIQTGTEADQGGTFEAAFQKGQMDCEDESMNAATYFLLLQDQKLIRHHGIYGEAHRGFFLNGWPHRALEIYENKTKTRYVLDSWFHDNGFPAEIIPAEAWHDGWRPDVIKKKKPAL